MGYVFYANYYQTWYPYNNTAWSEFLLSPTICSFLTTFPLLSLQTTS